MIFRKSLPALVLTAAAAAIAVPSAADAVAPLRPRSSVEGAFGVRRLAGAGKVPGSVAILRGGGAVDDSSDDEDSSEDVDEYDSSDEESEEYDIESESESDPYDEEYEESEYDEESEDEEEGILSKGPYDEPLRPSMVQQMGSSVGVMYLSKKVDLFDPKVVKMTRAAFVAYTILTQIFLAYVRIRAKMNDDRTPVTVTNPMSGILEKQLPGAAGGGGPGDMVKNLASQFLSSETTALEYDLKEAKKMGNALLFPLALNWFLHFKMGQVQPLLFQISSGMLNLLYSPLFQIYVLGRNLERPFKAPPNPMADKMEQMQKDAAEKVKAEEGEASGDDAEEEDETEEESDSDSDSDSDDDDETEQEGDSDSEEESAYDDEGSEEEESAYDDEDSDED